MLMQHPQEQKLDLCGKGLGADVAKALAECLKSNTTVTEVRFVYKRFDFCGHANLMSHML